MLGDVLVTVKQKEDLFMKRHLSYIEGKTYSADQHGGDNDNNLLCLFETD